MSEMPEVNIPFTPVLRPDGKIGFNDRLDAIPKLAAAVDREKAALDAMWEKIQADHSDKWAAHKQAHGSGKAYIEIMPEFAKEHLPEQHRTWQAAQKEIWEIDKEIHAARVAHLNGLEELGSLKGEEFKKAVQNFEREGNRNLRMQGLHASPNLLKNTFGVMHVDGPVAALRNTFGWENMKARPGKTAMKVTGVVAGTTMALDAVCRSGPEDNKRSWATRILEGGTGLVIATGSALSGRVR